MPAATPAWTPEAVSPMTRQAPGATPRRSAASRYGAGCGLPCTDDQRQRRPVRRCRTGPARRVRPSDRPRRPRSGSSPRSDARAGPGRTRGGGPSRRRVGAAPIRRAGQKCGNQIIRPPDRHRRRSPCPTSRPPLAAVRQPGPTAADSPDTPAAKIHEWATLDTAVRSPAGTPIMIQTRRHANALVSTERHESLPRQHNDKGAPPDHQASHRGRSPRILGNNHGCNRRLRWSRP